MKKIILPLILLLVASSAVFLLANRAEKETAATPTETPTSLISPTPIIDTSGWKTYTSNRFGYSFKYPENWHALFFDEENKEVLFGTHSIANYDFDQVESFMDHGIVDWKEFVGDRIVIKFDLSVQDLKDQTPADFLKQYFSDGERQHGSGILIGNLDTVQYDSVSRMGGDIINSFIAFHNSNAISANVSILSNPNNKKLESSTEWRELKAIFSSFKFN